MNTSNRHFGLKLIALTLVITIFATLLPSRMVFRAEDGTVPQIEMAATNPDMLTEEPPANNTIDALFEDDSLRTPNSKTLRLNDGSYTLGSYGFNIHFQTSNGFVEYDNTLVRKGDSFVPTLSDIELSFDFDRPSYSIGFDGVSASFELINNNLQPSEAQISELPKPEYATKTAELFSVPNAKSQLSYCDILEGVTVSYLIYGRNIKENIILETLPEDSSFRFAVTTGEDLYIDGDGAIRIGEASIPHAYMYDALGDVSDAVEYSLEQTENGYILTITPDREWLEAENRAYPVVIDPTIITDSPTHGDISDAYIKSAQENFNSNYYYLMHVGNDSTDPNMYKLRSFFRINNLPELPKASRILSATISLQQAENGYWYSFDSSYSSYLTVTAKEVTSAWSEDTLTWNNRPSFSNKVIDYSVSCADTAEIYLNFDITSCMQKWYEDSGTNYGIVLQSATEQYDGFTTFISTDDVIFSSTNPSFYITYYDTKGLESRWAYAAQDVGTAGTVYVNFYNGKPVLTGPGLSTQDEIIPYSVYPVYNGYLGGLQFAPSTTDKNAPVTADFNASAGYGFKLSCWESLTFKTISGVSYFCYNDADGTELYFRYYQGLGYLSEDGYDLKLNYVLVDPYYYSISDSNGNVKYFNSSGRISAIHDEYGNKKIFTYDASNRLTGISFQSKTMSAAEQQLTIEYNSVNAVRRISNAKDTSEYVELFYSLDWNGTASLFNAGFLRKVRYSNGDFAEYEYDSEGRLCSAKYGNGSTYGPYAEIDYDADDRVSALKEYGSSGSAGGKCTFQYGHKKAVIRTAGEDDIQGNEDDILSVYLFDNYGNTVCSYLTDDSGATVYGASAAEYTELNVTSNPKANNSVVKSGGRGQYNANLIGNGSFELTGDWTQTLSSVYCAASSSEYFFGTKSVSLTGASSVCSGTLSQSVAIPAAGTYTFSAYVKSSMYMGYQLPGLINGAYISLDGAKSEIISDVTDANVQNGWRKISVTKTFADAGTYTAELALKNMYGAVYFDGACLIKGDTAATEFNYLSNDWIPLGTVETQNDGNIKLSCAPGGSTVAYCFIPLNKSAAAAAFTLSGWSNGYGVPEKDTSDYPPSMVSAAHADRFWGISAVIYYTDGTNENQKVHFNPAVSDVWQYASGVIMPEEANLGKTISQIAIYLSYNDNANYALFKDVCFAETDASAYKYDSNGNVSKAWNTEASTQLTYSGTDLTNVTDSRGNSIAYTYVSNKHKVLTATDAQGVTATYGYNTNGLANSAVITPSSGSGQISSSAVYNNYGDMTSETDTLGHTTSYGYNTDRGLLSYIDNANSKRTRYLYDLGGKLTEVFADTDKDGVHDSGEAGITYTYNARNYLTEIYNGATTYHFAYDSYGNVTSVTIGANTTPLVSYTYAGYNGKLLSTAYADGTVISNAYDKLSRVKSVSYNGTVAYTVTYDGDGNIASYTDCATGRVYRYEYDALGREIRFFVTVNGTELYAAEKSYDSDGRSVGYKYTIGGVGSRTTSNTYDQYNRLSQETTAGGDTVSYTYDGFGRVITKTTGSYSEHYEYVTSGNNTSTLVSKLTQKYSGTTIKTVEYTYDNLGNILTEDDGVTFRQYSYDDLNQLKSELFYDKVSRIGEYRWYSVSSSGNVAFIAFNYNNGTYTTGYSSGQGYGSGTDWKELMTSFGGTPITYDANGNPLSYFNGQSYTFTWQKGRQLASAVTGTNTINYGYDAGGQRISKTVNGTTHTYTYDGSLLLCDKWGGQYVEYFYDATGKPYALRYYDGILPTKYYFTKNIEGDILELRSSANTLVARYIYDGWGKLLEVRDASGNAITSSTHIANLNSLRYRGYFYDTETKLYYLQSRYYDSQVQRFISPDVFISTGQGIVGHNMFAYCNNNPVISVDRNGTIPNINQNLIKDSSVFRIRGLYNYPSNDYRRICTRLGLIFGAESTTTATTTLYESTIIPDPWPLTIKTGNTTTEIISKHGESSKPISVYANADLQHPIKSSSAGIKLNFGCVALNISLGLDNVGIYGSILCRDTTKSFGVRINVAELRVEFEGANSVQNNNTIDTCYSNVSISGWAIVMVYCLVTSGEFVPTPELAY